MLIRSNILENKLKEILIKHKTSSRNAAIVARALVQADLDGIHSHGAARVVAYARQAFTGKVDGFARPKLLQSNDSVFIVDAQGGFSFPAIKLGLEKASKGLETSGIVLLNIRQSHHSGAIGQFIEPLAEKGFVVLGFSNAPAAIAPAGGSKALFGTNPIAFAAPRKNSYPLLIDLSLSKVARGKIKLAADSQKSIKEGLALDVNGLPTTDPSAALDGSLLPIGGSKGAALALMIEIICSGLSGSNFGFQAGSFFTEHGGRPNVSQTFILIDPSRFNPHFLEHCDVLFSEILNQKDTRIPGTARFLRRKDAIEKGIYLEDKIWSEINKLLK